MKDTDLKVTNHMWLSPPKDKNRGQRRVALFPYSRSSRFVGYLTVARRSSIIKCGRVAIVIRIYFMSVVRGSDWPIPVLVWIGADTVLSQAKGGVAVSNLTYGTGVFYAF
jgi:hypothetical protein